MIKQKIIINDTKSMFEKEKIKSFKEMGKKIKEREQEILSKRFNEVVGERIDDIPAGCQFRSDLPNIESISVLKQPERRGLFAMVYYKSTKGKSLHETFSIFPDGTFGGNIPRQLGVSKEQIYKEALDNLDRIGLDFWYKEPQNILNVPDWPVPPKEKPGGKRFIPQDSRRIEYLRKQPDALFGFHDNIGLGKGYSGFVFKNFIVLENSKCENASYFIDFPQPMPEEEIQKADSYTGRKEIIEKYWKNYENRGKWDLFTSGHERMIHLPANDWIPQMESRLNQRNPLSAQDREIDMVSERVD